MKFSWVMFICPLIIASAMTSIEFTHRNFESCDPNEWLVTDITIEYENTTKIITCNIIYKQSDIIHKIHIISCEGASNCTREPIVLIDDINCNSQTLSPSDMHVCEIGNELAKWKKEKEFLEDRYGMFALELCVNIRKDDLMEENNF